MTIAFVYKWTELSSNRWYIGSRTAKGCHPDDGYICSSKSVKPLILNNRSNWIRTILCIGNQFDMRTLETNLLTKLNAHADSMSYNRTNGGIPNNLGKKHKPESIQIMKDKKRLRNSKPMLGKTHSLETRKKFAIISSGNKNMLGKKHTEEMKAALSKKNKGKPRSKESIELMKATNIAKGGPHNKGVPCSEETKTKIRATIALNKSKKELYEKD